MPTTPLTPATLARAGIVDTLTAANAAGHTIVNPSELMWLEVLNSSVASIDVTIAVPRLVDGLAATPRVVAVGAGVRKKIGNFTRNDYNDATGVITVTFSAVVTVTCGAFTL
jgi:hypothetical protein